MEKDLTRIALFATLIAALGLLPQLTLGFGVPITAQSLGVMLTGTVLGARRGGLAVLLFVALVALGLPLLAGGRGGLGQFTSPTAGFLIGFPFAAYATGWITERLRTLPVGFSAGFGAALGGIFLLYAFGISGLMVVLDKTALQATALVTAFIPGDIIKAVLAGVITAALARARPGAVMSRA